MTWLEGDDGERGGGREEAMCKTGAGQDKGRGRGGWGENRGRERGHGMG